MSQIFITHLYNITTKIAGNIKVVDFYDDFKRTQTKFSCYVGRFEAVIYSFKRVSGYSMTIALTTMHAQ